jgi:hypothetical protein
MLAVLFIVAGCGGQHPTLEVGDCFDVRADFKVGMIGSIETIRAGRDRVVASEFRSITPPPSPGELPASEWQVKLHPAVGGDDTPFVGEGRLLLNSTRC